jgi:hypothetical protein
MHMRCLSVPEAHSLILNLDSSAYLTASLSDARRVLKAQGGKLFRLQGLYLVGTREEALQWGWMQSELRPH